MNVFLPYSKIKRVSGTGEIRIGKPIDFDEEKLDGLKDCIIVSIDQINRSESNEYDGTDIIKFDIAITFMNKHNIAKKILLPVKYEDTSGYGEYDLWLDVNINKK